MTIEYKDSKRIQGLEYTASTLTTSGFAQTWGKDPSNSQFEVSSGRINFLDDENSTGDRTWLDLQSIIGSAVSTTKWVLRFKFNFSTLASGSYYYEFDAGLSDTTVANNVNQNFIGVRVLPSTIANLWRPRTCDGSTSPRTGATASLTQSFSTATDYFVEIKRTSASNWSISLSTTDAYDGDLQDNSYTDASGATGLRYFKFGDAVTNVTAGADMQGVCDVLEFYNDTNTVATASGDIKPTNVQDNSLFVEKDTAKRYWFDVESDITPTYENTSAVSLGTGDSGTSIDLTGSNLDDSWVLRFKVTMTSLGTGSSLLFMIQNSTTTTVSTARDGIGLRQTDSSNYYDFEGCNNVAGNAGQYDHRFTTTPATDTKYVQITRTSATSAKIEFYNSTYTTASESSGDITIADITALRYLVISNNGSALTVDDIDFWNGVTSTITPATWTQELPVTEGLKLHLDASESSTITKDSSNLVSQWNDFSSQGNNISQATSSKQPLFVENVQNGKPVIRFDGSNDMLQRTTYVNGALTQPNTVFYVGKIGGNEDFTFASGTLSSENSVLTTGGKLTMYAGAIYGADNAVTTLQQYTFLYNTTSSTMRVNGSQTDTGSVGTHTMQGFTVGANYTDAQWSAIDVCEILVYNGTLSDTNRDKIESYLMEKWGLS